ncbi:acyl-CoA dehydrogenase family protein [Nocardia neocaledoniensis]|uniref:acyl-CoA dehydrogenase family protein n=1 Tax=Nocardia neocaledoniensis TaxID=236511 RepID=UPI0024578827|nr:acyl-CoA dehydrogenase family protein [Nocardia neocaledoniensis]
MTDWNTELLDAVAAMAERAGIETATPAAGTDRALWAALTDAGFTAVGIPEEQGGSGGTEADVLSVVYAATAHGALTPVVEHTALASRLIAECTGRPAGRLATLAVADGGCAVRDTGDGAMLDGTVTGVVHGADAEVLALVLPAAEPDSPPSIAIVATGAPGVVVERGTDLLGAALGDYRFAGTPTEIHESPLRTDELEERGALAYAVALAAAASAVRDGTLRYAAERTQFGRSLAKFQAVQQRLAGLAALTALMESAAAAAAAAGQAERRTAIAAAKVIASVSAREVAAAGHQLHGAIGFTAEHSLGRSTTALWNWRDRYGSERYWSEIIGAQILDAGADPWELITGTAVVEEKSQ